MSPVAFLVGGGGVGSNLARMPSFQAPCDKNKVCRRFESVNCDRIICRIGVGLEYSPGPRPAHPVVPKGSLRTPGCTAGGSPYQANERLSAVRRRPTALVHVSIGSAPCRRRGRDRRDAVVNAAAENRNASHRAWRRTHLTQAA